MRLVLLFLLVITALLVAGSGFAQPGMIALYSDLAFTDCFLVDGAPGLVSVFAVHNFTDGATASQFAIAENHAMSYLAYASAHQVNVGNDPRVGVAVTYDAGCSVGPILLGTISYFANGLSPLCSDIAVVPDPVAASGQIEGVDCFFNSTFPFSERLLINGDGTCFCGPLPATEESTWGGVKALYR